MIASKISPLQVIEPCESPTTKPWLCSCDDVNFFMGSNLLGSFSFYL